MGKKLVAITYFKETGKYLTSASYLSEASVFDIPQEVVIKRSKRDLPGLETEEIWSGYCLLDPEGGARCLLDFTPTSNE